MSRNLLKEIVSADDEFILNTVLDFSANSFREFCEMAIKQQDRDTRHACAEGIYNLTGTESATGNELIYPDDVHKYIMNCRKGLK